MIKDQFNLNPLHPASRQHKPWAPLRDMTHEFEEIPARVGISTTIYQQNWQIEPQNVDLQPCDHDKTINIVSFIKAA